MPQILIFLAGFITVAWTFFSALETFVLPRNVPDKLTQSVFLVIRFLFVPPLKFANGYVSRDRIMAFYAPISLMTLVPTWYVMVALGYSAMYYALGVTPWTEAYIFSGSSLLTLGFVPPQGFILTVLAFSEAAMGLILVALLIAYLPTMYTAFQRREAAVNMLEVRAGNPPSAIEMLLRYHRIHGLERLSDLWPVWEAWFSDIDESHTSLPPLVFFRSPTGDHSWVTSSGAVLDAAALTLSSIDIPPDPGAMLCSRAGFLALRHIADFFTIPYDPDPHFPEQFIRISRDEYDGVCGQLAEAGVPMKPDREQAWRDFGGWRVNYEQALLGLCTLTMAPPAPWSSDRAVQSILPPILAVRSLKVKKDEWSVT